MKKKAKRETAIQRLERQYAELARQVRDGVDQAYGIRLVPEPVLIGTSLEE